MKKLWSAANVKVYGGGVAVDDGGVPSGHVHRDR